MRQRSLYFVSPRSVELREAPLPEPGPHMVRVRTVLSAISPGTELLIYRGEAPRDLSADATIAALGGSLDFPLKYGYACAGVIEALGAGVSDDWLGRRVFAFNPHETHFIVAPDAVQVIPDDIDLSDAVFLPNMESAVNFVMDAQPLIGEVAAVIGQGVVGLLTTALLARMPLSGVIGVERLAMRRAWSTRLGASVTLDPADAAASAVLAESADVSIELSGAPAALDTAIALTGYGGRVVIASWYGAKRVSVDLGGRFHRSRMRLIASQVSTLAPELGARWDKSRRMAVAWRMLREVRPSQLITQRLRFDEAARGYHILDQQPDTALQVVFEY